MSTERGTVTDENNFDVNVTSFNGGSKRGAMVQLTQNKTDSGTFTAFQSVQLTKEQARQLIVELQAFTWE